MPQPSRRRRLALVGGIALLVLLAATGWLAVRALAARSQLVEARVELLAARAAIEAGRLSEAREAAQRAADRTAEARALTGDPVWGIAGALPRWGATPATLRGTVRAVDDVARRVLPELLDAAQVLQPSELRGPDGTIDLAAVQAGTTSVVAAQQRAVDVAAALAALPVSRAAAPVAQPTREVVDDVSTLVTALDAAERALRIAPVLLGQDRPRRYLVLVQQTSESRGTGGIFGGFVELVASQGRLTPVSTGSNSGLRNGDIEVPPDVPADFVQLYGDSGAFQFWQNANLSPDLPVVAEVVDARWQAQGGQALDGVVVLDAVALSLILQGEPPLALADGQVAPADLPEYLAVGQYRDFAPSTPTTIDRSPERKDQLEEVAVAVASSISSGGGDALGLLQGLVEAVRSGHLRMASDDPALQPLLAETGVDGGLPDGPAPLAYPVVSNATAGKLDFFLERRLTYAAAACDGPRRRSTVTLQLTSAVPDVELPPYLTTQLTPSGVTTTRTMTFATALYVTPGAELLQASVDGVPVAPATPDGAVLTASTEAGVPRFEVRLDVAPGQTRTLELRLDEPTAAGAARVLEQPLARPLVVETAVPECPA